MSMSASGSGLLLNEELAMFQIQEAKDKTKAHSRLGSLLASVRENQILTVVVEPSSKCNLRCSFCDLHSGRIKNVEKYKGVMSLELFRKFVDQMTTLNYKLKQLQIHGSGEPLLNKQIVEFIRYAYDKQIAESIRLTTNGTMLTPAILDKLMDSGVNEIRVSLDAADPELYQQFKGKDLYRTVHNNIIYAIDKIEAVKGRVSLVIKYPLPTDEQAYGVTKKYMDTIFETYGDLAKDSNYVHIVGMPVVILPIGSTKETYAINEPCEIPFFSLYVKFDGRVSVCCADITELLEVGDINQQTIGEIIDGEKLRRLRIKHIEQNFTDMDICEKCGNRTCVDIKPVANELLRYINK